MGQWWSSVSARLVIPEAEIATIDQRGPRQFRARVRRKAGGKTVTLTETFETLKEAQDWAKIKEGEVAGDEYVDRKAARAMTVAQACEWFMDRIAPVDATTGKRVAKSLHG